VRIVFLELVLFMTNLTYSSYDAPEEQKERMFNTLKALFYLRDPSFSDSVPSKERDVYNAENYMAKHKTSELKEFIKSTALTWRGYRYLDNFGQMVKNDLISAVNARFQGQTEPDSLQRETLKHEAFSSNRSRGFHVQSLTKLRQLHEHINTTARVYHALAVSGPPGSGPYFSIVSSGDAN